jgi:hypothetical protein
VVLQSVPRERQIESALLVLVAMAGPVSAAMAMTNVAVIVAQTDFRIGIIEMSQAWKIEQFIYVSSANQYRRFRHAQG